MASNIKTEPELGNDNYYALFFYNNDEKTQEEIEEIFSKYGTLVNVRFAGKNLVFIRYREYEEAKRCLDDMKRTREFYMRIPNKGPPKNNFDRKPGNEENNVQENSFHEDKRRSRQPDTNGVSNRVEDQRRSRQPDTNEFSNRGEDQRRSRQPDTNEFSNRGEDKRRSRQPDTNEVIARGDDLPPPLVEDKTRPVDLDLPGLVGEEEPFEDVLIANLPPEARENTITELLEYFSLSPLHITPIEMTGIEHNYLYSHVWFEDLQAANKAEQAINGLNFRGRKLVAIKASTILKGKSAPPKLKAIMATPAAD